MLFNIIKEIKRNVIESLVRIHTFAKIFLPCEAVFKAYSISEGLYNLLLRFLDQY